MRRPHTVGGASAGAGAGRRWTAVGMAFCALAGVGPARAQSLWDDPAFALYRQAVEAVDRKDYQRARQLAGQAIAQYPNHLLAHYLLGQAAMAESRWDDAVTAFESVLALYGGSFAARRELGIALEQLGRTDEARHAWDAALALRPDDEDVRARVAFMLLRAGDRDAAAGHLQALADRPSTMPEVWVALGRIQYERGQFAASEKAFARAVQLRDDGKSWFNLAVVRYRLEDRAGSRKAFERASQHAEVREQALREIEKLREAEAAETPPREPARR